VSPARRRPAAGQVRKQRPKARSQSGLKRPALYGLVVAAGSGRRFGGPKQFARLCGRPLLLYSLEAFEDCPGVRGCVVVVGARQVSKARALVQRAGLRRVLAVIPGGAERADSVRLGLARLPDDGFVAIHDAARPLLTPAMLKAGFAEVRKRGPVTLGRLVTDTVKRVQGQAIEGTVPREDLATVQTPQFFPLPLIKRAHALALSEGVALTDDCALVERLGIAVGWIAGPADNIKVTARADLALAARLLCARSR
jgi:2-C-methyl-D-erythritol 4-phosphate cytidylyltransferase